jgi:SAM-dependent methyltransferase
VPSFDVDAGAYGRFMGRYSEPLALDFVDLIGPGPSERVLDVGCGPGAVTAVLVERCGAEAVSALDPSEPFVAAARARFPEVDVRIGVAEDLPFADETFDASFGQLIVHFLSDADAGAREMRRVTRPGGTVAVSVWDYADDRAPLSLFWRAASSLDPTVRDESGLVGAREGQLVELLERAGFAEVESTSLTVDSRFETFDEWWQPFTLGVGPAGDHVQTLDDAAREQLRARCASLAPPAPFEIAATAWVAIGRA